MPIIHRISRPYTRPHQAGCLIAVLLGSVLAGGAFGQSAPITARFEPGCEAVQVLFSTDLTAQTYSWQLSTGATSNAPAPVLDIPYGQELTVSLSTMDAQGGTNTFTQTYPAFPPVDLSTVVLPTVMTPNGDGINDVFTPIDGPYLGPCAELAIFDRYGHKVFENEGNDLSWDGRLRSGAPCIPAVYFYVLVVNSKAFTGHITLFQ